MTSVQLLYRAPAVVAEAPLPRPADLFMLEVRSDHMEPTYRAGEHQLVMRPTDRFEYDAVYALTIDGALLPYRCQSDFRGGVHVQPDNPAYSAWTVPRAAFAEVVLGIAVGEVKILDRGALTRRPTGTSHV